MPADYAERTEAPTPRRRREARTGGQIARSHDLVAALMLLTAFIALRWLGPSLFARGVALVQTALEFEEPWSVEQVGGMSRALALVGLRMVAPLLLLLFLVVLVTIFLQVGPLFTWKPVKPSLARLNPMAGIGRLFSVRSLIRFAMSLAKLAVVAAIAYATIGGWVSQVMFAGLLDLGPSVALGGTLMSSLGIRLGVGFLVLALLDLAYQRFQHERDLRMTKEEVKDEYRSMEGDPAVKKRRRQLHLRLNLQRIRKEVPQADVVVTNPTHLAIALRYDGAVMPAPRVVAKGADEVALRIRQIAAAHGIPIVERKSLVRLMYDAVQVGQFVPERFYQAIAEILAYVYELTGRVPRGLAPSSAGA